MEHGVQSIVTDNRCFNPGHPHETEYNTVEEEPERVRILPARPLDSEPDYADRRRDLPRPPQHSSLAPRRLLNAPPKLPKRNTSGPSVNRDSKPTRIPIIPTAGERTNIADFQNVQPPPRPPKPVPRERQPLPPEPRISKPDSPSTHSEAPLMPVPARRNVNCQSSVFQASPTATPREPPRCSQDLEFKDSLNSSSIRPSHDQGSLITAVTRNKPNYNHEWPQVKKQTKKQRPSSEHYNFETPRDPGHRTIQISHHHNWYIGACDRYEAENALYSMNTDGGFLVRDCSKKVNDEPYVLAVFYGNKVYNIKIRYIESSQKFALGTGLWGNHMFDSVSDIIEFHKVFPLVLIDGKDKSGKQKDKCTLTYAFSKDKKNQILG